MPVPAFRRGRRRGWPIWEPIITAFAQGRFFWVAFILNVGPPLQLLGQLGGSDSSRAVNGPSRTKLRAAEPDPQHMEGLEAEETKALQGLQYLGLSLSFQGVRARPRAWWIVYTATQHWSLGVNWTLRASYLFFGLKLGRENIIRRGRSVGAEKNKGAKKFCMHIQGIYWHKNKGKQNICIIISFSQLYRISI